VSPEAQRIAIAEACGWERDSHWHDDLHWHKSQSLARIVDELPCYLEDLNVCLPLLGADFDIRVRNSIYKVTIYEPSQQWEATNNNLCEAICQCFLIKTGKWDDAR
jgi:hypothetical protein